MCEKLAEQKLKLEEKLSVQARELKTMREEKNVFEELIETMDESEKVQSNNLLSKDYEVYEITRKLSEKDELIAESERQNSRHREKASLLSKQY